MRILLIGIAGFMGQEVVRLAQNGVKNAEIVAGVDKNKPVCDIECFDSFDNARTDVDCIIDFSHHSLTEPLLKFATENRIPLVLATTGQTEEENAAILEASKKLPIFFSSNYSLGIALLIDSAKKVAAAMPEADIEIIEYHHNRKLDAPSGTAKSIFNAIKEVRKNAFPNLFRSQTGKRQKNEIGIHSVRSGNIVGIHEVIVGTESQTITLRHHAHNRAVFAEGALAAAEFLIGKNDGLYEIADLLKY